MSEQELQNDIKSALSMFGVCYRVNAGGFYTKDRRYIPLTLPRGFSDLIFIRSGRANFIEVKVKHNKPSREQAEFIRLMKQYGCRAGVAYSVDDALKICGLTEKIRY